MVQKSLDLKFVLPIIVLCALKRVARTFKKEELRIWYEVPKCTKIRFILDKKFRIIYTNCSKVLHQMTAPMGGVIDNKIALGLREINGKACSRLRK